MSPLWLRGPLLINNQLNKGPRHGNEPVRQPKESADLYLLRISREITHDSYSQMLCINFVCFEMCRWVGQGEEEERLGEGNMEWHASKIRC